MVFSKAISEFPSLPGRRLDFIHKLLKKHMGLSPALGQELWNVDLQS